MFEQQLQKLEQPDKEAVGSRVGCWGGELINQVVRMELSCTLLPEVVVECGDIRSC
jgi:hypothetical protein